ncbi:MAG: hypothetical protein HQK83_07905 [Fibrobacteria bacterium]|nr:hypothetical protein [Fibrobacteria bacterium]
MKKIKIHVDNLEIEADLFDTPTAKTIEEALPFEGEVNVWGEEIYFDIPVSCQQEPEAREEVEPGDLAFWPTGSAFCIFFGPTPVSTDDKPRAYSPVNVFGHINGGTSSLKTVSYGAKIIIEKVAD